MESQRSFGGKVPLEVCSPTFCAKQGWLEPCSPIMAITGLCLTPVTIPRPALLLFSGHCGMAPLVSGSLPCLPCWHPQLLASLIFSIYSLLWDLLGSQLPLPRLS